MRSLAEMENVRTRSTREVDNAKKFGSQVWYAGNLSATTVPGFAWRTPGIAREVDNAKKFGSQVRLYCSAELMLHSVYGTPGMARGADGVRTRSTRKVDNVREFDSQV